MTKVTKGEFYELREGKVDKETHEDSKEEMKEMISDTHNELKKFQKLMETLQENMTTTIYDAVKKANIQIQKGQEKLQAKKQKEN